MVILPESGRIEPPARAHDACHRARRRNRLPIQGVAGASPGAARLALVKAASRVAVRAAVVGALLQRNPRASDAARDRVSLSFT